MNFDFIEDPELRQKAIDAYKVDQEEKKAETQRMIDEAITGLKTKNDQLLDEKKKLQEKFSGINDPEEALEALRLIQENEDIQLIKDGKIDELLAKRTSALTAEYDAKIAELTDQLGTTSEEASKFKSMFQTKMVEDTLREAAIKAGVRPEALSDVILRGNSVFSLSDTNEVEARDQNGNLLKVDGIVVNPSNWVDGLKETSPHYWPASEGAGASGAGAGADSDTMEKLAEYARTNQMGKYNELRAKMEKSK